MQLLFSRHGLDSKKGVQWLVGSPSMPYTVISVLQCLHFHCDSSGDPDFIAESADIRVLLPKGLEIVGAVLNEPGSLETARKAGEFALTLATHVSSEDTSKPSGVIAACLEPGGSNLRFYYYKGHTRGDIEAFEDIMYPENPSAHLWTNMHLLQCKLQLKVPLYARSFANLPDYKAQLLTAVESIVEDLRSERLYCLVKGLAGTPRKCVQAMLKPGDTQLPQDISIQRKHMGEAEANGSQLESLRCSDFCSSDLFTSPHGLQVPVPLKLTLMLHQSMRRGKVSAPCAEYLPASGGAILRVLNLNLDAVCLAHHQLSIHKAVASLVLPALIDQLLAMKDAVLQEFSEHLKLCSYHFCPPGFIHPISCIYDISYGESELRTVEHRQMLHRRLGLPMDRPLLRIANTLSFLGVHDTPDGKLQGRSRLSNLHINLPTSSGVVGGHSSIIQGSYEYYHYLQDNINDSGWGCAYRSLQTIISWFRLQHYTTVDVPTHKKIQEVLVDIGDKEPSFTGSQNWIGAIELSFVLDKLLGISSKILNVRSGAELPEKCRELALHFETQGTPIMIGGGVLAYTLLGVDYNDTTGDSAFLILDPHYTGGEDLKSILGGGWCGWKKAVSARGEFFLRNKFYNLLLPQRPNTI